MSRTVKITTEGIKSVLERLSFSETTYYKAISEYIWNGFDAGATKVELNLHIDALKIIQSISVKDNGIGIPYDELSTKFGPFYESEKVLPQEQERHQSIPHGKRGIGRLTFFTFAHFAKWTTIYSKGDKKYKYDIDIAASSLQSYKTTPETDPPEVSEESGTVVTFSGVVINAKEPKTIDKLRRHLTLEFGWFLELNKPFKFRLLINGEDLNYEGIIGERQVFEIITDSSDKFELRYIRWKESINDEHSKFYYIGGTKKEKYKECTTLNNQGDQFYHSLFITSNYFDDFYFISEETSPQSGLTKRKSDTAFKELRRELDSFLRKKRKPFLKEHSKALIEKLEKQKVIVADPGSSIDLLKASELKTVIAGLYEIEPRIFSGLNQEQNKAVIGLLNLTLDSSERENIIEIIEKIVDLKPTERKELAELLKVTRLSCVLKAINLIKHRYMVLEILKKINFEPTFGANEVDHLQKVIELNTWIFEEQYSLVAAAEDDFDKALRNHWKLLHKDDDEDISPLEHPDKKKQVDIFLCRQKPCDGHVENLIIELKHPSIHLGEKQISQIKKYFGVIDSEPRFNGNTYTWKYILIGSSFDGTKWVENDLKNMKNHGEEDGVIFNVDNRRIYVYKWCDVINNCKLRHDFLNDKLQVQKEKLAEKITSPEEAVKLAKPPE